MVLTASTSTVVTPKTLNVSTPFMYEAKVDVFSRVPISGGFPRTRNDIHNNPFSLVHAWLWLAPRWGHKYKASRYTVGDFVVCVGAIVIPGVCEVYLEAWITFHFMQLLLSGDIEMNPGPVAVDYATDMEITDAKRNERFQEHIEYMISKLGDSIGAAILGAAPLGALGPAFESIKPKTVNSHIRMIERHWVPFCNYKGYPLGVFTGVKAAECAGLVLDTTLADSGNSCNVEHLIHRLNNALQFFGRITGGTEDLSISTGAVRTRATNEQAKRALAQVPGAGYLTDSEFKGILVAVGHRTPFIATVMRAFLTIGLCLFLRGGHAAMLTLEGMGVLPGNGGVGGGVDVYALSLPFFKKHTQRTVYAVRNVDALVCPIGNLAALVWTRVSECGILDKFEEAIHKGEPSVVLNSVLFAFDNASGVPPTTDALRSIVKQAMDTAGVDRDHKDGVLKLLRPSGAAKASGAGVSHEQIQALGGWAQSMVMLTHYLDKSPESSKAVVSAMAGKVPGSSLEVPRASVKVPAEWLNALGVSRVNEILTRCQNCVKGGTGDTKKGFKLMTSVLKTIVALGSVLLQDLPLRLDGNGQPVCEGALPPIPVLAGILQSDAWWPFYDTVHLATFGSAYTPTHVTDGVPVAVVHGRVPSVCEATGLLKPDKRKSLVEQLQFMLECAAKYTTKSSTLTAAAKQWVDKYMRVTRLVARIQHCLDIGCDDAVKCLAMFMECGVSRPLSVSMLQQLLLHRIGGAGDDSGFINGTIITFLEAHSALQRMCLCLLHVQWDSKNTCFKVVYNPFVGQLRKQQQQRKQQKRKGLYKHAALKRRRVEHHFLEHSGEWKESDMARGDILVVLTDANDKFALQLTDNTPFRVWIIQLTDAPVPTERDHEPGFIQIVGKTYHNKKRLATDPLSLSRRIDGCVVHPEAVLWVFAPGEPLVCIDPETASSIIQCVDI